MQRESHFSERSMRAHFTFCTILFLLFICLSAFAQWKEPPATGSPSSELPDRTTLAGQAGLGPLLVASLVNPDMNARNHKAVIEVQTDGLKIVDPAAVNDEPSVDEGHIEYRLDNGPIENTTSKTWSFEHLSAGEHLIRVALVTSDNHQIGKESKLRVKIP
jgi:hypothetical protein